jgi:ABC-type transport system substrate-binding protein
MSSSPRSLRNAVLAQGWTFHLRKDVRFHDGTPFDADAVLVNLLMPEMDGYQVLDWIKANRT